MRLKQFIFLVCVVFSIISPAFADDSYEFNSQTTEDESLLANYYLENGDYHLSELKRTKLRNVKIKHSEYFPHYDYDPDLTCRDFLREFDADAPDFFKYNDCIQNDKEQGKPLKVIYKIEGKYAKQAHQYLANTMGIGELKLICCYWGTDVYPSTSFVNPKDHMLYHVVFSSEETIEHDWNKITFHLSIEALREDI